MRLVNPFKTKVMGRLDKVALIAACLFGQISNAQFTVPPPVNMVHPNPGPNRAPAQTATYGTPTLGAASGGNPNSVIPMAGPNEIQIADLNSLLQKITLKRQLCHQRKTPSKKGLCAEDKMLSAMEKILRSHIAISTRTDQLVGQNRSLSEENGTLRNALKAEQLRNPASIVDSPVCYKDKLLKNLMLELGITENGNQIFSKQPVGVNGSCWSNGKKKVGSSATLCSFPLAVNVETSGGSNSSLSVLKREYIFKLNSCDLLAVHITDSGKDGTKEAFLNNEQCMLQWNKRTADAAMSSVQVKQMEDIIGMCFREHLLPPLDQAGGRDIPNLPIPKSVKEAQPTFGQGLVQGEQLPKPNQGRTPTSTKGNSGL